MRSEKEIRNRFERIRKTFNKMSLDNMEHLMKVAGIYEALEWVLNDKEAER